ncbi:MAG: hypothetical protein WD342_04345 [Verrucomicrobiales bacterium]
MAITVSANYQKRLGLPAYSSHSFQVSVDTEITDLGQVQGEVARLYSLLQDSVDREIQQTGFVPGEDYGEPATRGNDNGSRDGNGNHAGNPSGTGDHPGPVDWNCSDKQRRLIADLAGELGLTEANLDARAERLFRRPARRLDKLGASGLISDLLAEAGTRRQRNGNANGNANGPGGNSGNRSRRRPSVGAPRNGGGA